MSVDTQNPKPLVYRCIGVNAVIGTRFAGAMMRWHKDENTVLLVHMNGSRQSEFVITIQQWSGVLNSIHRYIGKQMHCKVTKSSSAVNVLMFHAFERVSSNASGAAASPCCIECLTVPPEAGRETDGE